MYILLKLCYSGFGSHYSNSIQNHPQRYEKLICVFILTLLPRAKGSLARAGFGLAPSGFWTAALPIGLSSQRGLVASLK